MDLGGKSNYARHPDVMSLSSPGIHLGGKLSRSLLVGSISAGTNKVRTFNNCVNNRVKRVNLENLENSKKYTRRLQIKEFKKTDPSPSSGHFNPK